MQIEDLQNQQDMMDTAREFLNTTKPEVTGEFDKNDLIRAVAHQMGSPVNRVSEYLDEIIKQLRSATVAFGRVEIHGLGVFRVKQVKEKTIEGIDGQPHTIPDHKAVKFKAAKKFQDEANDWITAN